MRERKRKNFNQGYKSSFLMGRASILVMSVCLVFMLGILYLSQANKLADRTDTLNSLEQRKQTLQTEKDRLEIEAARLQSIQEIQKAANPSTGTKYVPVGKINYLPTTNVALR